MKVISFLSMFALALSLSVDVKVDGVVEAGVLQLQNDAPVDIVLSLKNKHRTPIAVTKVVQAWREAGKPNKSIANLTSEVDHEIPAGKRSELTLSRAHALPPREYDVVYDVFYKLDDEKLSSASSVSRVKVIEPAISFLNVRFLAAMTAITFFAGLVALLVLEITQPDFYITKPTKAKPRAKPASKGKAAAASDADEWIPQHHLRSRTTGKK